MSTSNSWNYLVTATDIIESAFENLGWAAGEAIEPEDSATALRTLNFIAKQWQGNADMAQGVKIGTRQRITLFLAKGQQCYTIGPAATDSNATTAYGHTTISADEAIGQTTLNITSITDTTTNPGTTVTMTAGDLIGIEENDGTIQWTTVSSTGAGPTVVIPASGLTVAADAGRNVYWFTSLAQRFPVLEYAVLRNSDHIDVPLSVYTDFQQYEALPDKTADGDPISILVEPLRLNTRITTDFQPTDVTKQIVLTVLYPAEDYDVGANDIAFPQESYAALEWELTLKLAPKFDIEWTNAMQQNYAQSTSIYRQLNPENSSAYFEPGRE